VVEIQAATALVMVHLSRLSEELVLWSSQEFGFIELPDDFATGSSLMPQKKNPDVPELVRGRTGRVIGELTSMLTTLKGLPLAYNRDLQGDKESFFIAVDTTQASLEILAQMIPRLGIRVERMLEAASDPQTMATEVADYLVLKGVPFRRAHEVVGKAVRKAQDKKISLAELDLKAWRALDPAFDDGVSELFDPRRAIARRHSTGTPGPAPVKRALVRALLAIKNNRQWLTANNPRS
jgi:argininosuccinate lyase